MEVHWIMLITVLQGSPEQFYYSEFYAMMYFQITLPTGVVGVAWQFCARAAYSVSPPCWAVTCHFALLQQAGFWRPMKSHLALAPVYIKTVNIMSHHIKVSTIFLEIQRSTWLISHECVYWCFPSLFHIRHKKGKKGKFYAESFKPSTW